MKLWIVVGGMTDEAILRALLPSEMLPNSEFVPVGVRSSVPSLASTILVKYRQPVAVLLDTDSLDGPVITELLTSTDELLRAVAGRIPFKVIVCIPHIETIVFDSSINLARLFPKYDPQFFLAFAKFNPKAALDFLFKNGGGPTSLSQLLASLTPEDVAKLQGTPPIHQLMEFYIEVISGPPN
jgi:hypothetical protein